MEVNRVFLDVRCDRKEILVDEGRDFIIGIGFGLQPNARASSRSGAEVEQQRLLVSLRLSECHICVFVPLNSHFQNLLQTNLKIRAPLIQLLLFGGAPDLMRSQNVIRGENSFIDRRAIVLH